MDINELKKLLPKLLPEAIQWAKQMEEIVILQGYQLNKMMCEDAKKVGVVNPEKIRILEVEAFPLPENPALQQACITLGFLGENTAGLTLGHGILIKSGLLSRRLLSHECRHVFQYEQAGSTTAFLQGYLSSLLEYGYFDSPYEKDARKYEIAD